MGQTNGFRFPNYPEEHWQRHERPVWRPSPWAVLTSAALIAMVVVLTVAVTMLVFEAIDRHAIIQTMERGH